MSEVPLYTLHQNLKRHHAGQTAGQMTGQWVEAQNLEGCCAEGDEVEGNRRDRDTLPEHLRKRENLYLLPENASQPA